jgi:uncharacterized membrane protein YbhN (UPF0104 family)
VSRHLPPGDAVAYGIVPTRLRTGLLLLALAASIVVTCLALRGIDFGAFFDALAESGLVWFTAFFAILVVAHGVRVARWWVLFDARERPPVRVLVRALLVGATS